MEGSLALVVDDVRVSAPSDQQREDLRVGGPDCQVDARLSSLVRNIQPRPSLLQQLHSLQAPGLHRPAQGRHAAPVLDIEAGQEATISYCPPHSGNITRREKIERLWQFQCRCPRCLDGTELGTFLSGVKCRDCQAGTLTAASSDLTASYRCGTEDCARTVSRSTILALTNSLAAEVAQTRPENILELIAKLESVLHTQHYLIMELRQRWVDITMEDTTNTRTEAELVRVVEFLQVITAVNSKIEPGYSVSLGTNLRHLNTAMLGLAKLRLQQQKIDKKEFMMIARKAAENIKIAKKWFENTSGL